MSFPILLTILFHPNVKFLGTRSGGSSDSSNSEGRQGGGSGDGIKGNGGRSFPPGGLRRLEHARADAAVKAIEAQENLVVALTELYSSRTQRVEGNNIISSNDDSRYIDPHHPRILGQRVAAVLAVENLCSLTWELAVRRANCFSQVLGIAITAYLAAISDIVRVSSGGFAPTWREYGFPLAFEGLLSAAGKELGMIEDASGAVRMLRMVEVTLVPDDESREKRNMSHLENKNVGTDHTVLDFSSSRVPVIESPYLNWVEIIPKGKGSEMMYSVVIGVDTVYHSNRVPAELRDGVPVRFYPILFQMGVDIRQWGANAGAEIGKKVAGAKSRAVVAARGGVGGSNITVDSKVGGSTMTSSAVGDGEEEEEEEYANVQDSNVLVALNFEAFRKLNAYAHATKPLTNTAISGKRPPAEGKILSWEEADLDKTSEGGYPIHPLLDRLHGYLGMSAGRMEHGVLDAAATVAAKLGGISAVFCKSGKDRTAMHATFKQSQFVHRFLSSNGDGFFDTAATSGGSGTDESIMASILKDAALMRLFGTRLPICEKNVGQSLYAFNSLQSRFMPDTLKPPPKTLAGFLKGGRVFSREGMIES